MDYKIHVPNHQPDETTGIWAEKKLNGNNSVEEALERWSLVEKEQQGEKGMRLDSTKH